jgi:hypothetical protein
MDTANEISAKPGQPAGSTGTGKLKAQKQTIGARLLRQAVVLHRWVGILICLFFVLWFVSGLVLMYVHFPKLTNEDKLATLTPIEWGKVEVTPEEALALSGLSEFPEQFSLEMAAGEPVYRMVDWSGVKSAFSAVSGQRRSADDPPEALRIVQQNLSAPQATLLKADVNSDQWTVTGYWDYERPFHIIALNDPANTHYYVSISTGEIVLDTVGRERFWNYLGAVPHWMYFEFIRANTDNWFWVIIILGAIGSFLAILGMWLGISRLRLRQRYSGNRISPFRSWAKWHHVVGLVGGVFLTTWIITGMLSVYPGGFLEQREVTHSEFKQYAGNTLPQFDFPGMETISQNYPDALMAHFSWVGGRSLVVLKDTKSEIIVDGVSGAAATLADDDLYQIAESLMPAASVIRTKRLETGDVIGILDDIGRLDRWFNAGVHNIDLAILFNNRPLWDIVVWVLMLSGLFISVSGVVIGVKRLQFDAKRRRLRRAAARQSFQHSDKVNT